MDQRALAAALVALAFAKARDAAVLLYSNYNAEGNPNDRLLANAG
jgi:hypothetical protein